MDTTQLEPSGDATGQQRGMAPAGGWAEARRRDKSVADLESFWRWCDARQGADPVREPDWDDHLRAINASRRSGLPGV